MIDIASGLALENNKVFVYAMAPFLSLRALEQVKCGPGADGVTNMFNICRYWFGLC